jgi:hypothetical protein
MSKKLAVLAFVITLSVPLMAQTTTTPVKKAGRPDIPGTFTVELGVNRLTERPNNVKTGLWGSRTANLYYQYDMRIGKSKFSFHPGVGVGMERFKFLNYLRYLPNDTSKLLSPTLIYDNVGNTKFVDAAHYMFDGDTLGQISWGSSYRTKKSMLAATYIDVPVELRWNLKPEDPAHSFKIAVGGRVGYLLNAHTKIKYKEDGELKKLRNTQLYNLNRFRYSIFMKIYVGNFGLFGYYNLNTWFKDEKGPSKTQASVYTIGISLASF